MILSQGRNYLFIHIPKTGGTALALALEDRAKADDLMLGDTPKARNRRRRLKDVQCAGRLWKHSTLADIQGLVPEEVLRGLFTFTLVRNPWDRAVSYYHWLKMQSFDHSAVQLAKQLDFDSFLHHPQTQAGFAAHPPSSYMRDARGHERCDLYIRIEQFETDARPLFDHLGFSLQLPRVNPSERERDWRPYFSASGQKIIAACCAEEINRFEYSFNDCALPR